MSEMFSLSKNCVAILQTSLIAALIIKFAFTFLVKSKYGI